jgi:cytochrome c oxidase cbb3-type subunit 3
MTTDPKDFDGADPHRGAREVDPVSGYDTTGHDWGGIKELNRPFPKVALIALALTVVYSVVSWVLLPAWPLGRDYTRGMLWGWTSKRWPRQPCAT